MPEDFQYPIIEIFKGGSALRDLENHFLNDRDAFAIFQKFD